MRRIYNITESLVNLYGWKVLRLDIQRYEQCDIIWYAGHLTIETNEGEREELIIRDDGTFEIRN